MILCNWEYRLNNLCKAAVPCPFQESEVSWAGNLEERTGGTKWARPYKDELRLRKMGWNQHWFLTASKPSTLMTGMTCKEKQASILNSDRHTWARSWTSWWRRTIGRRRSYGLTADTDQPRSSRSATRSTPMVRCAALSYEKRISIRRFISPSTSHSKCPFLKLLTQIVQRGNSEKNILCWSEHSTNSPQLFSF